MNTVAKFMNDESGATAIEYGLIASLIVIAMIGALKGVASENIRIWDNVKTTSANAIAGTTP